MTQRKLTEAEKLEIDALNQAVTDAIEKRKKWLDAKMVETSRLKVGDDIYDIESGDKIGIVSGLYRYDDEENPLYDTSYRCDYEYEVRKNCFDNTSSQIGLLYGTKEDAARYHENMAAMLR